MSDQWPTETAVNRGAQALREVADWRDLQVVEIVRIALSGAGLPDLLGTTDTARALHCTTGGLDKFKGLPKPVYPGDNGLPSGGRLWLKESVDALAESRLAKT